METLFGVSSISPPNGVSSAPLLLSQGPRGTGQPEVLEFWPFGLAIASCMCNHASQTYLALIVQSLRLALCLTPGNKLRQRAARFPAILSCTQVNWIHPWSRDALQIVALGQLADVDIPTENPDVDVTVVAKLLCAAYEIVEQTTGDEITAAQEGQKIHVRFIPKIFLDHLSCFKGMLVSEQKRMENDSEMMTRVMDRIEEVNVAVTELEAELTQKAVDVDEKKAEEEALLLKIKLARVNTEEEQVTVANDAEEVQRLKGDLAHHREICATILREGEPTAKLARDAIHAIKPRDLIEMKANPKSPHVYVENVLFAMLALREVPSKNHDWPTAKLMLRDITKISEDTESILAAIGEGR
jgi:dynein heavy chain